MMQFVLSNNAFNGHALEARAIRYVDFTKRVFFTADGMIPFTEVDWRIE